MTRKSLTHAFTFGIMVLAGAAGAQIRPAYLYPPEPQNKGMQLGDSPLFVTPFLGVAVGRDDNLFLTNTNKKATTTFLLSPGFSLDARGASTAFMVRYQGQVGRYAQSDDDNYVDHALRASFDAAFDQRNFLRVGLDWIRSHDPRGSTDRGISGRPDIYRQVTPSATYAFGTPGAAGRVELYASNQDKVYQNNRATTAASDRENREFGGAVYVRVAPKTYVMAEARATDISYKQPLATRNQSGEERRYFAGVSWDASAATTGTLKAGQLKRHYDTGGEDKTTAWEGIVAWSPRSYSKVDFYTSRTSNESTGAGRFILSSIGGLSWNHAWNSLFSTGLDLRVQKDEYKGFDRRDEIKSLGLKAGYKLRRWLTLGAEYTYTTRDSNSTVNEYDKNLYLLTATASM